MDRERKSPRKGGKREKVIKCAEVSYITCLSIVHTPPDIFYTPPLLKIGATFRIGLLSSSVTCGVSCHVTLT